MLEDINADLRSEGEADLRAGQRTPGLIRTIDDAMREHVHGAIVACDGNKARAARALGLDRRTLYRWLARWKAGRCARRSAL